MDVAEMLAVMKGLGRSSSRLPSTRVVKSCNLHPFQFSPDRSTWTPSRETAESTAGETVA
jgi:hypothetical protein